MAHEALLLSADDCGGGADADCGGGGGAAALPLPSAPAAPSAWAHTPGADDACVKGSFFPAPAASAPPPATGAGAAPGFFPAPLAPAAQLPRASGPAVKAASFSPWALFTIVFNLAALALLAATAAAAPSARSAFGGAAGAAYFLYLLAALCSPSARALRAHMTSAEVLECTERLRGRDPVVWAAVECWHYEERTETHTETDAEGRKRTVTRQHKVRVVSHRARSEWRYAACRDASGAAVYQPGLPLLRIKFKLVQDFDSEASARAWRAWRADFYARNDRDVYQDKTSGMDLRGLEPHVMLRQTSAACVDPGAHLLAVLALGGAAYECLVFQATPQTSYRLIKVLSAPA